MIPVLVMLLAAPVIGSFLGAMAMRIPDGRPLLWARSECESCRQILPARELVPLASFIWLRGRCASCGAPIGFFPFVMEAAAIAVVGWAATLQADTGMFVASCFFGWMLLLLAAIDWRVQLLPDVLTLPLMLAGLVVPLFLALGSWRDHAVGAAAGFVALVFVARLYHRLRNREGLGFGDAKLLAAIGAWVGWQALSAVVFVGSALGLLFAIALFLYGRDLRMTDRLPFGVFLSAGGWLTWLYICPWLNGIANGT